MEGTKMKRNFRVLGIVVIAAFVISAFAVSMASAETKDPFWFTSDAAAGVPTTLTDQQVGNFIFTTDGGEVACSSADLTGSVVGPTFTTITLSPSWSGCSFAGFPMTIDPMGCVIVYHADEKTTPSNIYHLTKTIECTGTNEITITVKVTGVTKCTIKIPPQNLGTGATVTSGQISGVGDLTIHFLNSTVQYTEVAGSGAGACKGTTGTSNGKFSGTTTLRGFNPGGVATSLGLTP
jgi:hypothetical protein